MEADKSRENGPASKKQKVEKQEPFLPADVLALVLNFLVYEDVRTCLLAGKIMAVDAARVLSTLNITQSSQLNVRATRDRFPGVTEVNIFCLDEEIHVPIEGAEPPQPNYEGYEMNVDTVAGVVPFLGSFPKLGRAHVGGTSRGDPYSRDNAYHVDVDYLQDDHRELMRGLVLGFCGAFQVGVLPQNLKLSGLVNSLHGDSYRCQDVQQEADDEGSRRPLCMLCR